MSEGTKDTFNMSANFSSSLNKNIDYLVPPMGLQQKLEVSQKESRPLIIKLGFDPTAPDLHLGHAVVLKKLRDFQVAGHKIVVIIGDFTARIGDPTGRNSARPPLSDKEVEENAKTYISQLSKVLDITRIDIRYNSEWLNPMSFTDVVGLMSKFTLSQMMQRDDFNKRYEGHTPIHMHELLYPLMQGQDSVIINADVEIGGTDQLFNCQVGRTLQEAMGKTAQIVISMPLLVGLDGKEKMSKSKNNYIGLTDEPNVMYGKAMSIPDEILPNYLDLVTDFDDRKIQDIKDQLTTDAVNPMVIKKQIATNIVKQYHGAEAANEADLYFYNQFQNKNHSDKKYEPVGLSSIFGENNDIGIVDMCKILRPDLSKNEIRRLISGNGVKLNTEKVMDSNLKVAKPGDNDILLQIGKLSFYTIGRNYD